MAGGEEAWVNEQDDVGSVIDRASDLVLAQSLSNDSYSGSCHSLAAPARLPCRM